MNLPAEIIEQSLSLGTSILCGFCLGLERERRDKPAGIKTMVLIAVGSALYMMLGELIVSQSGSPTGSVDPARLAAQVVSGIGFIGGGTIIQARGSVQGLTSAAAIWVAAAVGLFSGAGFRGTAILATILVLFVLSVLSPLSKFGRPPRQLRDLSFLVQNDTLVINRVMLVLEEYGLTRAQFVTENLDDKQTRIRVTSAATVSHQLSLVEELCHIDGVTGEVGTEAWGKSD